MARKALLKGFDIKGSDSKGYHFGSTLVGKYEKGEGRHGLGPAPDRLKQLGRAILAVQKGDVNEHPNDNPPQRSFLYKFKTGKGIVVFSNSTTCEIVSMIYSDRFKQVEKKHTTTE